MIDMSAALIVAFLVGHIISPTKIEKKEYAQPGISDVGGERWSVYIDSTDNPNRYRGVYEMNGQVKYEVIGRGISDTLEKLIEEIEG